VIIVSFNITAQNFQGKAIYQTKIKVDDAIKKRLDSAKIPDDRKAFMQNMMKKMMEKSYVLNFDKTASIYKEDVALEQPNEKGFRFRGFSEGVLYKNSKDKKYTKQKEVFGKIFLIKDDIENTEWTLEKETKMIGNHMCFKATTMKVLKSQGVNRFRRFSRNKKTEATNDSIKKEPKLTKVTVWYTPEIPISQGPADYQGLPGLILEVNAGNQVILCTKIVMNPKEKALIEAPKKGKEVTQKEYDKIVEDKTKEMREQFKNNRKKGEKGGFRRHG
jgi:GLPGLI family protein